MKVSDFAARADIVGRRMRVAWRFVPEDQETLADIPPVILRRKLRDFSFPPPAAPDPFLVYDSNAFPPAPIPGAIAVTDLASWELKDNSERTVFEPVSVAASIGGRMVEVLRRTTGTTYDANGTPISQSIEILDVGGQPGELQPNAVYYYQVFSRDLPAGGNDAAPYRSSAMVTDTYGLNRTLYESLPEIYRRHDVVTRPITAGTDSVPEEAPRSGQLRRLIDIFGIPLDSMRGTADGLRTLHDLDQVDARYLPLIAQWIGWELSADSEIPLRRNELKTAPRLYRLVGTLPGLRTLVSQYTGWFTQVAEFAQNLTLSNRPPQRNLFAVTPSLGGLGWHGVDDAAEILGFGSANQIVTGSAGVAAALTGTAAEPFALNPGMQLMVAADGLLPAAVRFGYDDFADISRASAVEVAAAIQSALPELNASASAGRVVIASQTVGSQSEIAVIPQPASLVSLENAPAGKLSTLADSQGRIRIFYESWETPGQPEVFAAVIGANAPSDAGNYVLRRVRYKTFIDGVWRDSHPILAQNVTPQADPAAVSLPDDRIWAAWCDAPQTDSSWIRFAIGASRIPAPARVLGQRREPFALTDGAVVTLTGNWAGVDRYTIRAPDFANLAQATANEVVAAMNGQLTRVIAVRERDGSIRLETLSGGAKARIAVDLRQSTAARALGFSEHNANGVQGSWSEEIDWAAPMGAVSIAPGRHAELAAINDPAGGVRLAWSRFIASQWRIVTAHWDEQVLAGTANGFFRRAGSGPWTAVAGLPSNDVRAVVVDANGTAWIATANGVALRRLDGTITALAPALPSADVRGVVLGRDSMAWFATAAGVAARAPDGTLTTITTADSLPSNDVRALALADDGTIVIATANGAMVRHPNGDRAVFDTASGLPSSSTRDAAIGADGTIYLATTAGLAILPPGGTFSVVDASNGLPSSDVRAVRIAPDGSVWVATARGVSQQSGGGWTTFDSGRGLASDDTRIVAFGPDGATWAGTALGISVIAADGSVSNLDLLGGGGANPAGQTINTGWSEQAEIANGGGGNREAALAIDEIGRTWLAWSQRIGAGNYDESWGLHNRIFDPATQTWGSDVTVTVPPAGGRSSDRTPGLLRIPGGMRVFFSSDRNGGFRLWSVDVTLAGVAAPLVPLFEGTSADLAPAPFNVGGAIWILYRSDQNVSLAQLGSSNPSRSQRVPDNGTIRRYAGSVSMALDDLARMHTRRSFGDLLSYTPNRPDGGVLADDELYTRGTVGLYVSRANQGGSPLTRQESQRLRDLLARFIPVNLRALVILTPSPNTELIYQPGADIGESYSDVYPFAEMFGSIADTSAAAMPGLVVIQSNTIDNISANPADLTTLRRRTYFPPLQ